VKAHQTEMDMTDNLDRRGVLLGGAGGAFGLYSWSTAAAAPSGAAPKPADLRLSRKPGPKPKNILFILTDDHRYDAMGFMKAQSFGDTPTLDRLAREGVHFRNAFVTTALCSPSRASILTGLYAHQHKVVDNNHPIPPGLVFYPQYLQQAGYDTAFIGKWHMGNEGDAPQPGFDHWVSFKGQGTYLPSEERLNVNGRQVPQKGYITDELTDYALDWIGARDRKKPWMMHLAHKAVHAEFIPAERHKGRYDKETFRYPESMKAGVPGRPMWVENQRNSWHGVDFAYHGNLDIADYYKRYMETLLAVDEGIARIMDLLEQRGELDDTLIVYMGDNGFMFGEHGLIDKRTAYEESMRTAPGKVPIAVQAGYYRRCGRRQHRYRSHDARGSGAGAARPYRRREHAAAGAGQPHAVAPGTRLRVLLGTELPADPDGACLARGPVQVHTVPWPMGLGRALRSRHRPARERQPSRKARS
jgi:N-acetylglucosamine-6-sulfatase